MSFSKLARKFAFKNSHLLGHLGQQINKANGNGTTYSFGLAKDGGHWDNVGASGPN